VASKFPLIGGSIHGRYGAGKHRSDDEKHGHGRLKPDL
jgi:hypothetical protein